MSDDPPKRTHAVVVVAIIVVDVARGRDQRKRPGNRRKIQRVTYMVSLPRSLRRAPGNSHILNV